MLKMGFASFLFVLSGYRITHYKQKNQAFSFLDNKIIQTNLA